MKPENVTGLSHESFLERSREFLDSAGRLLNLEFGLLGANLECLYPLPWVSGEPGARKALDDEQSSLPTEFANAAMSENRAQSWRDANGSLCTAIPVTGPDRPVAVLIARDPSGTASTEEMEQNRFDFLRHTARQLADEFFLLSRDTDLSGELSARYDQLQILYTAAGRLVSPVSQAESFRALLGKLLEPLNADVSILSIPGRKLFEVAARRDLRGIESSSSRIWSRVMRLLEERVLASGRSFFSGSPWDPQTGPAPLDREAQALALRIERAGSSCGILALLRLSSKEPFRSGDIRLVESLAEQISLAVKNTELYEDLQEFLMSTVKSLVSAIEAKDPYTSGHSERVHLISMLVGRRMGLSPEEMDNLRWASILHDVGKIGMPESILCKTSPLTEREYEMIKEHPARGCHLLQPIRQLAGAARVVRAHHERIDGQGYPDGLRGDEIPLAARIIAVADCYDAMTTTRPYRKAATPEYAVEEIRRCEGTQLDIEVVGHLVRLAPFLREHRIMIHADSEILFDEAA